MNRKRGLADQGIGWGKGVCYAGSPSHGLSGYSWLPPLPYNPGCETGHPTPAKVAELVDAQDLGSCGVTRESSNLSFRTKSELASVASSRWPKARL